MATNAEGGRHGTRNGRQDLRGLGQAQGANEESGGAFTNNGRRHAEGQRDYSKGGAKQAWGDTKGAAHKAKRGVKDAFD